MAIYTRESIEEEFQKQLTELDKTAEDDRRYLDQPYDPLSQEIQENTAARTAAQTARDKYRQKIQKQGDHSLWGAALVVLGLFAFLGLAQGLTRVMGGLVTSGGGSVAPLSALAGAIQGSLLNIGTGPALAILGLALLLVAPLFTIPGWVRVQTAVGLVIGGLLLLALPRVEFVGVDVRPTVLEGMALAALLGSPMALWTRHLSRDRVAELLGPRRLEVLIAVAALFVGLAQFLDHEPRRAVSVVLEVGICLFGLLFPILIYQGSSILGHFQQLRTLEDEHRRLDEVCRELVLRREELLVNWTKERQDSFKRYANKKLALIQERDSRLRELERDEDWSRRINSSAGRRRHGGRAS